MTTADVEPSTRWHENSAPVRRWPALRIGELWTHRELIYFFALRDLKVRYEQAVLGAGWAVIQPLAGALAFTLLFHGLADIDAGDSNDSDAYYAFAVVGFVAWAYVSSAVVEGANSLLYNADLVTKVAFPKIAAPAAALLPGLVDYAVGLVVALAVAGIWSEGVSFLGLAIGLPAGTALLVISATGPAVLLSAVVVRFRDARVVLTFGVQLALFVTPVAYPPELVPERWEDVQYVNPVAGALALVRWGLTGSEPPSVAHVALSSAGALALLLAGLLYFRSIEGQLVDVI